MRSANRLDRRGFLGAAAMTVTGARFGRADAQGSRTTPAAFGEVKQIAAGVLSVGYADLGPGTGPPVILLHGWPYDIHSFADAAALLAVGRLPGGGSVPARVRHHPLPVASHGAQRPAVGSRVRRHRTDGCTFDPESRDRRLRLGRTHGQHRRRPMAGALQGDGVGQRVSDRKPGCEQAAAAAASRARVVVPVLLRDRARPGRLREIQAEFAALIWRTASPRWQFDEATFERSAKAFDNPDHVSLVIHNYRWRLGLAEGESKYAEPERQLATAPAIAVPTITLEGDANGAPHPDPAAYARKFTGKYRHHLVTGGIGHNLPQESPQAFADAVVEADRL